MPMPTLYSVAIFVTDIERAKLELQKAERDYKRAQELLAEKLISQELYDNTKTSYAGNRFAIAAMSARPLSLAPLLRSTAFWIASCACLNRSPLAGSL